MTHLLEHARVLAPHGTVHHGGPGSLDNGPCSPDRHSAVDDCQRGSEELNVSNGFTHEILYAERVADMQNIDLSQLPDRWSDIHSNGIVVLGNEFEERAAHLS